MRHIIGAEISWHEIERLRSHNALKPGNDVFIVWNRGWQRLLTSPRDLSLVPESQVLAVKVRWTLRR